MLRWQVADGQRLAGPARFAVRQGDTVTIEVLADQADELHLHGDELKLMLRPGEAAQLIWRPAHSGLFDMELHHAGLTLAQIEVLPR